MSLNFPRDGEALCRRQGVPMSSTALSNKPLKRMVGRGRPPAAERQSVGQAGPHRLSEGVLAAKTIVARPQFGFRPTAIFSVVATAARILSRLRGASIAGIDWKRLRRRRRRNCGGASRRWLRPVQLRYRYHLSGG
jgi:hypothetical protein